MKKSILRFTLLIIIALVPFLLGAVVAHAEGAPEKPVRGMINLPEISTLNGQKVKFLIRSAWPVKANDTVDVILQLWTDAGPITPEQMKDTKNELHLFLLSPDFKQFFHLRPIPTDRAGEYRASFVAKAASAFRAWVAFSTAEGDKLAAADMNFVAGKIKQLPNEQIIQVILGDLKFSIDFDDELLINKEVKGHISVISATNYKPYRNLQPVQGAFAHVAAFAPNYVELSRLLLNGDAPKDDAARGGPVVHFTLKPRQAGMTAIFAHFKIDGRDVVVPFVVRVAASTRKVRSEDLENKVRPEYLDDPGK